MSILNKIANLLKPSYPDFEKMQRFIFKELLIKYQREIPFNNEDLYKLMIDFTIQFSGCGGKIADEIYVSDIDIALMEVKNPIKWKLEMLRSFSLYTVDETLNRVNIKFPFYYFEKQMIKKIIFDLHQNKKIDLNKLKKIANKPVENHKNYYYNDWSKYKD